jgi:hypothetical protein
MKKLIALAGVLLCVSGCGATIAIGPDRVFTVDDEVQSLKSFQYAGPTTVAQRNNFITERMFAMDLEYSTYFARLTKERQLGGLAGDLTLLGLTATSTVVPVVATKNILSAASTAVTGAKTSVDEDVYVSQTIQILQSQMEASRLNVRNRIMGNLQLPLDQYSGWQGLSDLEDYYRAGTVAGALEALAAATGSNSQQAKNIENGTTQTGTAVTLSSTRGTTAAGGSVAATKAP